MSAFEGKVIAITGAASGIGLALSKVLSARGAKLALADIQQDALNKAIEEVKANGCEAVATLLNVTSRSAVDDWISSTVKHFGKLDGAANLAGIEHVFANVAELEDDVWKKVLDVNLMGVMYCVRAQIKSMKKGASIVNAASFAGLRGRPGLAAYVASKHAVIGLTRTVAKEVGGEGIRVNAVAPGPVETPMLDRLLQGPQSSTSSATTGSYSLLPLQRKGQPEELARSIAFLLSDDATYVTGEVLSVDGGMAA